MSKPSPSGNGFVSSIVSKRLTAQGAGASVRASRPFGSAMDRFGWVELHWYEAMGIGRKELKIKRYLD
jgi:hypothetical protein